MQLLKDFSEINKVIELLNPKYREKLLEDVNKLIVQYINEQNSEKDVPEPMISEQNESVFKNSLDSKPDAPAEVGQSLKNLQASYGSKSGNLPPPPPATNPMKTRTVGTGPLIKMNFTPRPGGINKRQTLPVIEALRYVVPKLTDMGEDAMKNQSTPSDIYNFLKNVDSQSSLKEIYHIVYPDMEWGRFLERVYPISRERHITFVKNPNFPKDVDILVRLGDIMTSLNILTEEKLNHALDIQKGDAPMPNEAEGGWADKAKASLGQDQQKKRLLGDTLVELGYITQDQLNYILTLQRWFKNTVDSVKS